MKKLKNRVGYLSTILNASIKLQDNIKLYM